VRVSIDEAVAASDARVFAAPDEVYVLRRGRQTRVRLKDFSLPNAAAGGGDGAIKAPMHGRVLEIAVAVGERVAAGHRLGVIEAMKMEHTLRAPFAGVVKRIAARAGAQVAEGAEIMLIEPAAQE
jgi:3-methylcrotonyl-CoA carboxylase alpha subunit